MTIDLMANFFSFGTDEGKRLVHLFRKEIFEAVAKSDLEGMIFTGLWAFGQQSDWDYFARFIKIFEDAGGEIFYAELACDFETRLNRNEHPHRLECKPTKRDIEWSRNDLITTAEKHRLNSFEGELTFKNYIKIDNTNLPPEAVALLIKDKFDLGKEYSPLFLHFAAHE